MASTSRNARLSFSEREERILTAAAGAFSRCGFKGTKTKDIAAAADVNEALLFRHYPSKEKLYAAALQHTLARKSERFLPELEKIAVLPLKAALGSLARLFVRESRRYPELMRMLMFSGLESHGLARQFLGRSLPFFEWVQGFFAERVRVGELAKNDPGLLARMFISILCQYVMNVEIIRAANYYGRSERAVLKFFIDVFVDGTKKE